MDGCIELQGRHLYFTYINAAIQISQKQPERLELTAWHEDRYTLIEQSNTLIKHLALLIVQLHINYQCLPLTS